MQNMVLFQIFVCLNINVILIICDTETNNVQGSSSVIETLSKAPSVFPIGTVVMFASEGELPYNWLMCDGAVIKRTQFPDLFRVIGTKYGQGDGSTTFNLPDLRGRFPLGVDKNQLRVKNAQVLGLVGGKATLTLSVDQLPSHSHEPGSLYTSSSGKHSHSYYDPGHNHGGNTGYSSWSSGGHSMGAWGAGDDRGTHSHSISTDYVRININENGEHSHNIYGSTGSTGNNNEIDKMAPFQTINYMIYAGEQYD